MRNLLNAPAVVAWNTDKRYLADLADAGVPTVPSRFFAPGERVRLPAGEVVVKPAVGAGSVGAQRFSNPEAARRHAADLQADGRTVLVQPYDARVEDGETALVFLGGRQSHAFTKGPIMPPPGQRAGVRRLGHLCGGIADTCRTGLRAVGCRSGGAGRRGGPPPHRPRPSSCTPASTCSAAQATRSCWNWSWSSRRWAGANSMPKHGSASSASSRSASESALDRLGLGPLSHRRP